jgi:hypothetical protein
MEKETTWHIPARACSRECALTPPQLEKKGEAPPVDVSIQVSARRYEGGEQKMKKKS